MRLFGPVELAERRPWASSDPGQLGEEPAGIETLSPHDCQSACLTSRSRVRHRSDRPTGTAGDQRTPGRSTSGAVGKAVEAGRELFKASAVRPCRVATAGPELS